MTVMKETGEGETVQERGGNPGKRESFREKSDEKEDSAMKEIPRGKARNEAEGKEKSAAEMVKKSEGSAEGRNPG